MPRWKVGIIGFWVVRSYTPSQISQNMIQSLALPTSLNRPVLNFAEV